MSTVLAPASRLRLLAVHHGGEDPDLPPGTHLRWLAHPQWGLPLAPLEIWRVTARPRALDPALDAWVAQGTANPPAVDLRARGEATVWVREPAAPWPLVVGVQALASHDQPVQMRLLSPTGRREIARRSDRPCTLAGPGPWHLHLSGRHATELRLWQVERTDVFKAFEGLPPDHRLGPPVDDMAWHAGGLGEAAAWARVEAGAPLREPWIDRPEDAPMPLLPSDEVLRLGALVAEWQQRCKRLLDDVGTPPWAVPDAHEWPATLHADGRRTPWQRITGRALETWHAAALDTGLARWLGQMSHLHSLPRTRDDRGREIGEALLLAGVFAEPDRSSPPPDELETAWLARRLQEQPGLAARGEQLARHGLRLRLQMTVALNAPLPDRPSAPVPLAGAAMWHRVDGSDDAHFSRRLLLPDPPGAALLGVAVWDGARWQPRHERSDAERPRSRIRLPGSLSDAARQRTPGGAAAALVDEAGLPADGAPWPCRIVLGDLFGRYGSASDGLLEPPPRPELPQPALRATLRRDWPVRAPPLDAQPLADPRWWAQVDVPPPQTLPAGAFPVAALEWQVDGALLAEGTQPAPGGGGTVTREWPVSPAGPGQTVSSTLAVRFIDTQGREGAWSEVRERWTDGRLPVVPVVGQGLCWASRPGSGDEVVLNLTLPAPVAGGGPALRCRVYLGDPHALGVAAHDANGRERSRAEIGRLAAALPPERTAARDAFRLALPEPVAPGADGRCRIALRLPRALQTVQLLRVVPLGDSGQEPSFAQCPLLPVAVPSDRRPPPPQVEAAIDAHDGHLTVRIVAEGLDLAAVDADEPGSRLPEPPSDTAWPRWRLRYATGAVPRDFYARTLAEGELRWNAAQQVFDAVWSSAGLRPEGWPAYVPLTVWAEVAMPPERRLPAGVQPQAWPGGAIEPESPAALADCPRPFSPCSAPARAVRVPQPALALDPAQVQATATLEGPDTWSLALDVTGPALHPGALGLCRIEAAQAPADGDWQPLELPGEGALVQGRLQAAQALLPAAPLRLRVTLIDPLGVRQPAVEVAVVGVVG